MSGFMGSIDTLKFTAIAAAAIAERQLVGFNDQPTGLNGKVKGAAANDAATGDAVALTAIGLVDLPAGAAIAAGDDLISDANGKPIPKGATANPNVFAIALSAATAAGARVSVLIR